jgi:Glycosyl hydrolases family 31
MVCFFSYSIFAIAFVFASSVPHSRDWILQYNPVVNAESVITYGNARFSLLKDGAIRIEYARDLQFDDQSTVNILHRNFPKVSHTSRIDESTSTLFIETANYKLFYRLDSSIGNMFSSETLQVESKLFPFKTWVPNLPQSGNLHGTIRTLDRVGTAIDLTCVPATDYLTYYTHCEEGFASKDGWIFFDDTLRPRFEIPSHSSGAEHDDWTWPKSAKEGAIKGDGSYVDIYLFFNGLNHTQNLADYVSMAGKVPLLPRYALGPAFSRWYAYNEVESIQNVQEGFAAHGIPLDTLVVDMDWHPSYPRGLKNPYGVEVQGWTGWTPDVFMYPEVQHFFQYLRRRNVAVTFNLHPAGGVQFHEKGYVNMSLAMGLDPRSGKDVEFDISSKQYSYNLFKHILKPLDDAGLMYYWIDFQHGPFTKIPFLNPTFMCNYAWWTNPVRYGHRAPVEPVTPAELERKTPLEHMYSRSNSASRPTSCRPRATSRSSGRTTLEASLVSRSPRCSSAGSSSAPSARCCAHTATRPPQQGRFGCSRTPSFQ